MALQPDNINIPDIIVFFIWIILFDICEQYIILATSKLLAKEKNVKAETPQTGRIMSIVPSLREAEDVGRQELLMRLVEAYGGNFDLVRAELARLEQFAKNIKGA